jgi:hypothetical protein
LVTEGVLGGGNALQRIIARLMFRNKTQLEVIAQLRGAPRDGGSELRRPERRACSENLATFLTAHEVLQVGTTYGKSSPN